MVLLWHWLILLWGPSLWSLLHRCMLVLLWYWLVLLWV